MRPVKPFKDRLTHSQPRKWSACLDHGAGTERVPRAGSGSVGHQALASCRERQRRARSACVVQGALASCRERQRRARSACLAQRAAESGTKRSRRPKRPVRRSDKRWGRVQKAVRRSRHRAVFKLTASGALGLFRSIGSFEY